MIQAPHLVVVSGETSFHGTFRMRFCRFYLISCRTATVDPPATPMKQSKHRRGRISDPGVRPTNIKPPRLTIVPHPIMMAASNATPLSDESGFTAGPTTIATESAVSERGRRRARRLLGSIVPENGPSETSEVSSPKDSETCLNTDTTFTLPTAQPALSVPMSTDTSAVSRDEDTTFDLGSHLANTSCSKTARQNKKAKRFVGEEKDLLADSRGFLIYPKAVHNTAKHSGIHRLTQQAFVRLSHIARLSEEGTIEDGTLVWVCGILLSLARSS